MRVLVRDPSIRDLLRTANDEIKKEIFREAVAQNNLPLLADLVRQYMLISHVTFNNVKEVCKTEYETDNQNFKSEGKHNGVNAFTQLDQEQNKTDENEL